MKMLNRRVSGIIPPILKIMVVRSISPCACVPEFAAGTFILPPTLQLLGKRFVKESLYSGSSYTNQVDTYPQVLNWLAENGGRITSIPV